MPSPLHEAFDQLERRLGRTFTADDHARLVAALGEQGPERVGDVVLDLTPEELGRWLKSA